LLTVHDSPKWAVLLVFPVILMFPVILVCSWILGAGWIIPNMLIKVILMLIMLLLPLARAVQSYVRTKGYDWIGMLDALYLFYQLSVRYKSIPPREDLRVIPRHRDYDVRFLVEISKRGHQRDPAARSKLM
jgi:hypothetical protein